MQRHTAILNPRRALTHVMDALPGERLLVISDDVRAAIGQVFAYAGLDNGLDTRSVTLSPSEHDHRSEVSPFLREVLIQGRPDLVVNCLRGPTEETPFRIKLIQLETKYQATRLGHGPGITMDMLTHGALALTTDEYETMHALAQRVILVTEGVDHIRITTPSGTNLHLSITGRRFFTDTKITNEKWGNLPTGEVLVGPVENSLEGTLVCDLAIGGIGPLPHPLTIQCHHGRATHVDGVDSQVVEKANVALATDAMASIVGEMAIGLNPRARIVMEFLETEKVYGTTHIAFGRNIDYPTGGRNDSANHMDFLISEPTVTAGYADGRERIILDEGTVSV
jgi:leucyl aminopeptidase (aminopeptidase T)